MFSEIVYDFFLSYANADREWAECVLANLYGPRVVPETAEEKAKEGLEQKSRAEAVRTVNYHG